MTHSAPESTFRLPVNVVPTHYDITIKTDLEKQIFQGVVKVCLNVKQETSEIVLNAGEDIELGKVSVFSDSLKLEESPVNMKFDKNQERITYFVSQPLPAGSKAEIKVGFSAKLGGNMMGYYKSSWECGGKTKYYAVTQFEPIAARRAFPCWDEPLLKATFAINLISRSDTINISNMPIQSESIYKGVSPELVEYFPDAFSGDHNGQWKMTNFETTPLMSTYLIAYANGHFKHLEKLVVLPLSGRTIPLRTYATEDLIHQAQFALDVKASVLPLYEKVFDVEYPLPKLDTLAVNDFDAGAMENWGLIIGRTSAILLDPKDADLNAKKEVAFGMSHEVAHMWFGNITTMEWWDYLYLNEGFATLMGEVVIASLIFPEWKADVHFISSHMSNAMTLDAKLSSHPIEVKCPDANFINQIFDELSYYKAASVLRMLSNYVGEELFLKGVAIYLKSNLYGNSVTSDLWDGISLATGKDIGRFMDNWITKIGFPVLTVTETANGIKIRQDRFLETSAVNPDDNKTIWNIPLNIITVDSDGKVFVDKSAILEERETTIPLPTDMPFKLNGGTTGVYRVLYTPTHLAMIAKEAAKENSAFSVSDRMGLVKDAFSLSKAGLARLSSALTLVNILKNEKEYFVWQCIADSIGHLLSIWWENKDIVDKLNAFRRALFLPLVEQLGYEFSDSESTDITSLRALAIGATASAKDESVIAELKRRFASFMATGNDKMIPANIQRTIFVTAVQEGGEKEYDAVLGIFENPKTPPSKINAAYALAGTYNTKLIGETFKVIKTKAKDQDIIYLFDGLARNLKYRRTLVEYFKSEYDNLYNRFRDNFSLSFIVQIPFNPLTTKNDLEDLHAFFKDKDTSKYILALGQMTEMIQANVDFIENSTGDLLEWLEEWEKN